MRTFCTAVAALAAAFLLGLSCATPVHALRLETRSSGGNDVVGVTFESAAPPSYSVSRTGRQEISVSLGSDPWKTESRPSGAGGGGLVSGVETTATGLRIRLSTNAFGYITSGGPGRFQITVFRDTIGSLWAQDQTAPAPKPEAAPAKAERPRQEKAKPEPSRAEKARTEKAKAEKPAARNEKPAAKAEKPAPQAAAAKSAGTPAPAAPARAETTAALQPPMPPPPAENASEPVAIQASRRGAPPAMETDLPMPGSAASAAGDAAPGQGNFFSVPYSVRTQLGEGSQDSGESQAAQEPVLVPGGPGEGGEVRFRARNRGPEDMRLSELASPPGAPKAPAANGHENGFGEVKRQVSGTPAAPQAPAGAGSVPVPDLNALPAVTSAPKPEAIKPGAKSAANQTAAGNQTAVGQPLAPPPPVQAVPGPPEAAPQAPVVEPPAPEPLHAERAPAENATLPAGNATAEGNATAQDMAASERDTYLRETLYSAEAQMANGDLAGALESIKGLLAAPDLPGDVREDALYDQADILYQLYHDTIPDHFREVSGAMNQALNYNLKSSRVPAALLSLGLLNLRVNNLPEAAAYFNTLKSRYPNDQNVPYIGYYWGEYYFNKGDYANAARQLQALIQAHADIPIIKQASFLLADSLHLLGYNDQAIQITDYMDKRWPLLYMENQNFLKLQADVENALGRTKEAKDHYWTFYNLNPQVPSADIALARIGDIYLKDGQKKAAQELYNKVIKDFPDKEGALVAKMRLAEEGIYDDPSVQAMTTVFDQPYNAPPREVYTEIAEKHPDSPLAPLALLKLAMWNAWHKQFGEALGAVQALLDRYPQNELAPRARELGDKTFALAVPQLIADQNYQRVVDWWEKFKFMNQSKLDDDTRLGVATCYWKTGGYDKALDLIQRYLGKNQVPKYSELALGLASNIYLESGAWTRLDELASMARRNWKIPKTLEQQLDYARAMSLENLNEPARSLPIWAQLAADVSVDPAARGNAMYYLAKASMDKQDLRRVFAYAQEALSLLLQTRGDKDKIKDAILMTVYATEQSGRYEEALKWAGEYDRYIPESDPEWASMRYKLANIYRKAGSLEQWKKIMQDIKDKKPDSLYGRMAASALDTYALERKAQEYAPVPN